MHPIAFHRQAKGWTQAELANRLGVNISTVQHWEQRGGRPRPARLTELAALFDITGKELLTSIVEYGKKERAA